MTLTYRKRVRLLGGPRTPVEVWANVSGRGVSVSLRVWRFTFNTRDGFTSAKLGGGFTWRDRDPR